jgi:HSP20 family molecular chaperone IbpA
MNTTNHNTRNDTRNEARNDGRGMTTSRADRQAVEPVRERPAVAPRVDVYETPDELVLIADLPGVTQENLKIDVADDRLTIHGSRASASQQAAQKGLMRELAPFDYNRVFTLPDGIDRDKIVAALKEGVLTLKLPKSAAIKPRRIEIKASS